MVLRKINKKMKLKKFRSCCGKRRYNLFMALYRCFILKYKKVFVIHYECLFGDHYHIGHIGHSTFRRQKYFEKRTKITLLYNRIGV